MQIKNINNKINNINFNKNNLRTFYTLLINL